MMGDTLMLPKVSIVLEGMRQEIVHAFTRYTGELAEEVDKAVERAIREMDWQGHIQRIAVGVLREAVEKSVEDYFKRGDGHRLVDEMVGRYFDRNPILPGEEPA